jgi:DHA1 family multidrug resistance protein-like MFS transporter
VATSRVAGTRGRWRAGLDPVVLALCAAVLVEWMAGTAILPLLPLFLRRTGGSLQMVGVVMAAFFAASFLTQYPLGRLSDRLGRRSLLVGCLVAEGLATVAFAVPLPVVAYIGLRALQGIGAGGVALLAAAVIAEVVPLEQRGRAFGVLYGSQMAGTAVGPAVGTVVGMWSMAALFVGSGALVLVALIPVGLWLPPLRRSTGAAPGRASELARPARAGGLWRQRAVLGVLVASVAAGVLIGTYETDWSLLLHARGASPWELGVSWTLFSVPFVLCSWPAGLLVDHWDRRVLAGFALVSSAAFCAAYPFLPGVGLLVGLGAAEAVGTTLAYPAIQSLLTGAVSPAELGRAEGLATSSQTGAVAVGAVVAGTLFGLATWVPFVAAAGVVGLAVAVLAVVWRPVAGRVGVAQVVARGGSSTSTEAAWSPARVE